MWDRRKADAVPPPRPAAVPAPDQDARGIAVPQPVTSARVPEPAPRGGGTSIGKAVTIVGDIYSEEDLFVDGNVQGSLDVKNSRLTIGPNGKAKSNVKAREVVIQGQVQGDVEATQKITIRKDGSLVGNIKTTGIIIEDDAYFKGSIDIVRKEVEAVA